MLTTQKTCEKQNKIIQTMTTEELMFEDEALSFLQKALLLTNGTVTDLLKLFTRSKIIAKRIQQEFVLSGKSEEFLCPANTPILKRKILLGNESDDFMYADSIFIYENLPQVIKNELLETDCPVGLLWKREKIEMYREIQEIRKEYCNGLVDYFNVMPGTLFLSRTYLLYSNRKTLGIITEKFPAVFFN